MQGLLEQLGGWTIDRVEGPSASREGILAALDRLVRATGPDDTCLIHYFGHGGVVRFDARVEPYAGEPVFYVTAARTSTSRGLEGVLGVELSLALARLDRVCANVSVILDCCKSGRTVRGDHVPLVGAPAWLPSLPCANERDRLLDVESHPRIVRLAGTSAMQIAYGRHSDAGDLGLLTSGFVEVVRAAELRIDRLTWASVVHRVRESAIRSRNGGEQWINLAGPRQRLVFSREQVELPRSVGYWPSNTEEAGWLRAGALQGVDEGDEWGIAELLLDERGQPQITARVRVDRVELGRAHVIASSPGCRPSQIETGASAVLLGAERRFAIEAREVGPLAAAIARTPSLRLAMPDEAELLARVALREGRFECDHVDGEHRHRVGASGQVEDVEAVVELLRDWARAEQLMRLTRAAPTLERAEPELRWGWFEGERRVVATRDGVPSLRPGARLWFELSHRGHGEWFVALIEIGLEGRPRLLNAAEPEGVAMAPGVTRRIGERVERRERGLPIVWPSTLPRDRAMPVTLLCLASDRPLELAHLVRTQAEYELLARRERRGPVTRSLGGRAPLEGPESTSRWGWQAIRYVVEPDSL